jgi:hypothetical protein
MVEIAGRTRQQALLRDQVERFNRTKEITSDKKAPALADAFVGIALTTAMR